MSVGVPCWVERWISLNIREGIEMNSLEHNYVGLMLDYKCQVHYELCVHGSCIIYVHVKTHVHMTHNAQTSGTIFSSRGSPGNVPLSDVQQLDGARGEDVAHVRASSRQWAGRPAVLHSVPHAGRAAVREAAVHPRQSS